MPALAARAGQQAWHPLPPPPPRAHAVEKPGSARGAPASPRVHQRQGGQGSRRASLAGADSLPFSRVGSLLPCGLTARELAELLGRSGVHAEVAWHGGWQRPLPLPWVVTPRSACQRCCAAVTCARCPGPAAPPP